ncbi:MAG TPA: DUF3231 family protein [Desulfosporosinus sp.]|nr:DUF3231 family protein [Desulfosporosinus sp.]
MNLTSIFTSKEDAISLNLGSTLGLWDVCRNKLILQSTLIIFQKQAQDKDLKNMLQKKIDSILNKNIDKIQKLLKEKGFIIPSEPNWQKKQSDRSPFIISDSILNDEEIAMSLRELTRMTLTIETEALRNAVDLEARELLRDIFDGDNNFYDEVIKLQTDNNWIDFPPYLLPH